MWQIHKEFDFCYGHRVWSQTLNKEYSLDSCLKCRHLHGHQGKITIFLESNSLKDGMVVDFNNLNFFKKWVDDTLDHKFIVDLNDPLRKTLFPHYDWNEGDSEEFDKLYQYHKEGYYTPWLDKVKDEEGCIKEMYEGLVFVEWVPTSENLSKWLFDIVSKKMNEIGIKVSKVQFDETPKSSSVYSV